MTAPTARRFPPLTAPRRRATPLPPPAARVDQPLNPVLRWTFVLLVFSIPFELPERSFAIEIPTITASVFLLATLLQPRACYARRPTALLWFVIYLYAFVVAAAWNGRNAVATDLNNASYWGQVGKLFLLILQGVLVFWAAYNLLASRPVARTALLTLAGACLARALLPLLGIARTTHVIWGGGTRVTAFGQNANNSAMILAAGFIALLGLQYGAERALPPVRPRWLAWPAIALLGVSVVDTGSRGGLVALVAGLVTFMFGTTRSLWVSVRHALVAAVAIGLIIVASYQSDVMRRRFEETVESGSLAGRERIYPTLWAMFEEHPVLGWGPVNNKYELGIRLDERLFPRRDAHNLVLEVLTSTGLVGTVPFLVGLGLCLVGAARARARGHGMLPAALAMLVLTANMSGNWIASKLLWLVLAYCLASLEYRAGLDPPPQPQLRRGR